MRPSAPETARLRPLIARGGARFRCFGDGVCCTDAHRLGPIDPREAARLLPASALVRDDRLGALVMRVDSGSCAQLGEEGCSLHARGGPMAKPSTCRRFPFELVATPEGGRVVTMHRCPCRTMGERPEIDLAEAEDALRGPGGRLSASRRVSTVRLRGRRSVSFARYRTIEQAMLARLAQGEPILDALGVAPLPELEGISYVDLAAHLMHPPEETDATRAIAAAGAMLAVLVGAAKSVKVARFGARGFDRAQARASTIGSPDAMLRDFVADAIWSLRWADAMDFERAREELATRVVIAEGLAKRWTRAGVRRDRAMAEAIAAVESMGVSAAWVWAVQRTSR